MADRQRWTIFAVLLAVLAGGIAVVAFAGGESDEGDGGDLVVERSFVPGTRQPELLVSVERELNKPDFADDGRTVRLQCSDADGRSVIQARAEWPFIEEPGYPLPHIHQPATGQELARISTCKVTGGRRPLAGRMKLRAAG